MEAQSLLERRGFQLIERRSGGQLHFLRLVGSAIRHEVTLVPDGNVFGCRGYVRFQSALQDSWSEAEVHSDVTSFELVRGGIVEIGTPGAACWKMKGSDGFVEAFENHGEAVFSSSRDLSALRDFLVDEVGRRPSKRSNVLLLGLAEIELGLPEQAVERFRAYLRLIPVGVRARLEPNMRRALSARGLDV